MRKKLFSATLDAEEKGHEHKRSPFVFASPHHADKEMTTMKIIRALTASLLISSFVLTAPLCVHAAPQPPGKTAPKAPAANKKPSDKPAPVHQNNRQGKPAPQPPKSQPGKAAPKPQNNKQGKPAPEPPKKQPDRPVHGPKRTPPPPKPARPIEQYRPQPPTPHRRPPAPPPPTYGDDHDDHKDAIIAGGAMLLLGLLVGANANADTGD